jgi:NAD(P)-dependent dehydrogenase (short-subunit alcohol dehydrogenase family)
MELFDVSGKIAIVTGASSGLGVQFAKALGRGGAKVALVARREERLRQVSQELAELGADSRAYTADVTREEDITRTVAGVVDDYGRIDILVNNAGIAAVEPTEHHSLADWNKSIATNLTGVFLFTKHAGQEMIKQRYGRIINISSMYGAVGNMYMPASSYHASKGAVNTFTRAVGAEWAKHNITVNALAPGFFESEMTQGILDTPEFLEFLRHHCPMGRTGNPGELDGALLLFASDACTYITGQVLYVDGGWFSV